MDDHVAVADLDGFAAQSDHSLDERRTGSGPGLRRGEDHDVATLEGIESRRELVDEHELIWLQRGLHRPLVDLVRLSHERLDDEEDDKGEGDNLDDLEEMPEQRSS